MKKYSYLILILIIFLTGCVKENGTQKTIDNLPNDQLYYAKSDYVNGKNYIINVDILKDKETTILETTDTILGLKISNNKVYAIFTNRVGYVANNKISYITSLEEYVSRFTVLNDIIYYGKDNNSLSDDIYERLASKNYDKTNEKIINDVGISQLLVDDYIYFKPNTGSDVLKVLRYNLDGTNKKEIYNHSIGYLIKHNDYLYFLNYDDSYLYKIKTDGSLLTKMTSEPVTLTNHYTNIINGYYSMGVIDNYLYYLNGSDNKLYKTDGVNNSVVINDSLSSIYIKGDYIYCDYASFDKSGIYLLDKNGVEIKKVASIEYSEYIID